MNEPVRQAAAAAAAACATASSINRERLNRGNGVGGGPNDPFCLSPLVGGGSVSCCTLINAHLYEIEIT